MFRLTSLSLILSFTLATGHVLAQYTQDQLRHRLDSFYKTTVSAQFEGFTKADIRKMPKYDRPDLAADQDFYMTVDPQTLKVPSEQKFKVMEYVASVNSKRNTYNAIPNVSWEERGPDNFGGRTRGLMWDPTDSANGYKKVWAGGVAGGLWYNTDITSSSTAWSKVDDFWPNMAVTTIAYDPSDDSTFYVGTGEGWYNADAVRGQGIWKSTDAGQNWTQLSATKNSNFYYVQKIIVVGNSRVLAATRTGLWYSDNGGTTWSSASSGVFADIELAANGDVYAAKGNIFTAGDILKSTNNGSSWSSVKPSNAGTIRRVEIACAPSDSNTIYAIAQNTSYNVAWIKKSTNGGSSWSGAAIPKYLNDTTKDFTRGQAWYDLILAVHPTNANIAIAGGIDLHKTTNGGTSWTAVSHWYGGFSKPYVHADQHAMVFRPGAPNECIFGHDGGVSYSSNAGNSNSPSFGTRVKGYNVTQFYSIAMENKMNSNYMLAGAQDNGSHKFTSSGVNSTTEVTGGDGAFCFIDQDNSDYQITSYVRNSFYRSTNGGSSFSSISSSSSGRFINPADYDDDANILYSAAGSNQIYRISGITGTISRSTVTVGGDALGGKQASHIRCSPYSSHTLFVGTSDGQIFKVSNANGSMTSSDIDPNSSLPAGYISCIEVGASDSQLLVTFTNYNVTSVWETKNAGSTWTNKEGNLPDMPVRWALYNPTNRNQVMLATEVGVWTTDDLSSSSVDWDPSNNGLANVRCDMLQLREVDNLVAIATHGRGAYTSDVFGDTSIYVSFSPIQSEVCKGFPVSFTNNSTGAIKHYRWTFTPDNVRYLNGTDSSSRSPQVEFTDTGSFTIQLYCSDSLSTDKDSLTLSNAVRVVRTKAFAAHIADFDNLTAAPASVLDSFWSLIDYSDYPWTIDSNNTLSASTGPSADAGGSGKYLFAEASTPAVQGDTAILESQCLSGPDTGFFKLAYHMYGSTMGDLTLSADTGQGWYPLKQWSGQQHSSSSANWSTFQYNLDTLNQKTFKLQIKATRGSSYFADIALDNLEFKDKLTECDLVKAPSCLPSSSSTQYNDGVYGVKIGSKEYTSSGANTEGAYTDRICTDTFYLPAQNFELNVNAGNSFSNRVRVYIDFDNNGVMDTIKEMVWYSTKTTGYRKDSIQVPSNVVKNTLLRMRIMADDDATMDNDPCAQLRYGESEDFGIKFIPINCNVSVDLGDDSTQCGGSITLSPGTYSSYAWSDGSSGSNLTVTSSGTYWVRVTDANGCTASDTIAITIHDLPSVSLGNDTSTCDQQVTLNAGSFSSYLWSTGSTNSSITVDSSDIYWVRVTDANSCQNADTINVSVNTSPTPNLGPDTTQCGGTITLSAGNYSSYSWSDGSGSSSITVSTSGNYWVEVTDANGCKGRDTIGVTINSVPDPDLESDTTQCGGSVELDAGNFSSYLWSTNSTSQKITVNSSGTYWVEVTASNGCKKRDSIRVTIHTPPTVSLGSDTTQCGGNITLNAGSFSSYSWSTGSTSSSIYVTTSGNYSVTVTDANGCSDSDTISVTIHNLPAVNLGRDTNQCGGTISLNGGSFSSYLWSTGSTNSSITISSSGNYWLEATDQNGCSDRDTIAVNIYSPPTPDLGSDTVQCGGTVTLNPGSYTSYNWSGGSVGSNLNVSQSGTYSVTVTDANGCSGSDTIKVTIHPIPGLDLGNDTVQCGGEIELLADSSSSYLWNTGATGQRITVQSSGTYSVEITDGNGCKNRDTIEVTIHTLPSPNLGNDSQQCGGSITLNPGNFSAYQWSDGSQSSVLQATTTDIYIVEVTDANGCKASDTVLITIHALPQVNLGNDTSICGGSLELRAGAFDQYKWSTGGSDSNITVDKTGTYSVEVTDQFGCTGTDAISVTVHFEPQVDLGPDLTQCGGKVTLSGGNFSSYQWNTGETTQDIEVDQSGTYSVMIEDVNGCMDSDTVSVTIYTRPNVNLGSDIVQCGGSASLSAGSFSQYLWSTGETTSDITVTATGEYHVEIEDMNGCKDNDTVSITIHPIPTVDLGADTSLCGGPLILDAGTHAKYEWQDGSTDPMYSVSSSGEFIVVVTNDEGCSRSDSIQVIIHIPESDYLEAFDTICVGDSLDAGIGSMFTWNGSAGERFIQLAVSGKWVSTKLDGNGCPVSDTTQLSVETTPDVSFTFDIVSHTSGTFFADFNGSVSEGADWVWYFGDGDSSTDLNPSHEFDKGTYVVELHGSNRCGDMVFSDTVQSTLSIINNESGLSIYPNPTSGRVIIQTSQDLDPTEIVVTNAFGQDIPAKVIPVGTNWSIDLSSFAKGVYWIRIENLGVDAVIIKK
jgi:hypothetical protein